MPTRRWFRSKARTLSRVTLEACAELGPSPVLEPPAADPFLAVVRAEFSEGNAETYALPLVVLDEAAAMNLPEAARIGRVRTDGAEGTEGVLCDASWDSRFHAALFQLLAGKREVRLGDGLLRGLPAAAEEFAGDAGSPGTARLLGAEQSNTAFAFTGKDSGTSPGSVISAHRFVKLYRRLEETLHPEPEVLRFLRTRGGFKHVPRFDSALEWVRAGRAPVTVALMQELVPGQGDGWEYTLKNLPHPSAAFLEWVALAGRRVAGLHVALASDPEDPVFAPEPLQAADLERVRAGTRSLLRQALENLAARRDAGEYSKQDRDTQNIVEEVLAPATRTRLEERLAGRAQSSPGEFGIKIRTHGDLHLGQILVGRDSAGTPDLWILDFEGEPGRPLAEARRKQSPLRDVAGMLRSFHYAAHTALAGKTAGPGAPESPRALAERLSETFWQNYARTAPGSDSAAFRDLMDLFVLEKTIYELHYELNNRPDWVKIPLHGLTTGHFSFSRGFN